MSRGSVLLVGVVVAGAWWFGRAAGEEGAAEKAGPQGGVAIIDIGKIFKDSPRLARLRDELKQDFEAESVGLKAMSEDLKKLQERAKAAQGNAADLKEIKGEFDKKSAEAKEAAAKLQKDFVARETEMYRGFHDDVRPEVEKYAKAHGLRLVLRYQQTQGSDEAAEVKDANDVKAVMNNLNQLVVYHDSLDITDAIVEQMKESGAY